MVERGHDVEAAGRAADPAAVPVELPAADAPTLADRLLDGSGGGILAHDHRGVVRFANTAARVLLPDLRVGELLVAALDPRQGGPDAPGGAPGAGDETQLDVAGRRLRVRHRDLSDGWGAWYVDDVTEQYARLDSLLAERARSRFLASASGRLGLSLHPGRTARAVVELAAAELAHAVAVVWQSSTSGDTVEWAAVERTGAVRSGRARFGELPAPVAAALRGLQGDAPLLLDDLAGAPWAVADGGTPWPGPDGPGRCAAEAGAVVSLPGNGVPAGALVLLRSAGSVAGAAATAVDTALVEEFAQRAGIAMAAAALYARQARTTGVLRSSLLPSSLPQVPGLTLGAVYRPADEGLLIGGDFYDVLHRPGAATTFLLGDVCGKGVDAAVSTGRVRQSVVALGRVENDPVRLLDVLNATMVETAPADRAPRFVTLVLGTATPLPGGGVRLVLAGGGHLPPLVVRAGAVEEVDIGGMLVGAVPEARFRARTVDLAPGESCVLYSDGVTEAQGGVDGRQVFGEERLAAVLTGCDVLPAPGIAERVAEHATRWLTSGYHDDIAVLVVQAPIAAHRAEGRHLHSVHTAEAARATACPRAQHGVVPVHHEEVP
jgi:serine phosphatase RsbU (regulator of sigma subunit)